MQGFYHMQEKVEKLEGDAALNKLFQEICSNVDENTRHAVNCKVSLTLCANQFFFNLNCDLK
jgi:hypothetical protein